MSIRSDKRRHLRRRFMAGCHVRERDGSIKAAVTFKGFDPEFGCVVVSATRKTFTWIGYGSINWAIANHKGTWTANGARFTIPLARFERIFRKDRR